MMKDKGFGIFLGVLFGIGGICILVFTWVQTMPASERIVSNCIGSMGILWALIQVPLLRSKLANKQSFVSPTERYGRTREWGSH